MIHRIKNENNSIKDKKVLHFENNWNPIEMHQMIQGEGDFESSYKHISTK